MPREFPAIYARNCFIAHALVVSKCDCGCGNTKLLLLDKHDRVRATATAEPDDLIQRAHSAKTEPPMRCESLN